MLINEVITEGRGQKCIIVDVQPAYEGGIDFDMNDLCRFIAGQHAPILMFVNADETGMTDDNIEHDIFPWWEEHFANAGFDFYEDGLDKMEFVDKGYGYFRAWMDLNVDEKAIIRVIREMYKQRVSDSRDLFDGEESETYKTHMSELGIPERYMDEFFGVEWTSVGQLKKYSGAYIMGGGRAECLREVELLMNAFNIKYKRIEEFVYG